MDMTNGYVRHPFSSCSGGGVSESGVGKVMGDSLVGERVLESGLGVSDVGIGEDVSAG